MIRRGDWVWQRESDTVGEGWVYYPEAEERAEEEARERQDRQDEEDERQEREEQAKHGAA